MLNAIVWMKRSDEHFDEALSASYGQKMTWKRAHTYEDVSSLLASSEKFELVITILDPSDIEILYQVKLCQEKEPSLSIIAIFDTSDVSAIDQALGLIIGNTAVDDTEEISQVPSLGNEYYDDSEPLEQESASLEPSELDTGAVTEALDSALLAVPDCRLTPRQRDVLGLIMVGKSNKEIARDLDLSEGTVKVHCMALFKEMSVTNRTQAALMAENLLRAV